tara:strand:- start:236 stop:346 length:111 start_codon:yes stop_codon:yes gene_type:complete
MQDQPGKMDDQIMEKQSENIPKPTIQLSRLFKILFN